MILDILERGMPVARRFVILPPPRLAFTRSQAFLALRLHGFGLAEQMLACPSVRIIYLMGKSLLIVQAWQGGIVFDHLSLRLHLGSAPGVDDEAGLD